MKKVLITVIILVGLIATFFMVNFFYSLSMVGSYPYAEEYTVNLPKEQVIQKIQTLKNNDRSLQVPPAGLPFGALTDGHEKYWYYVYFLLKDRKTVLFCFVRSANNSNKTTIGLVNVGIGSTFLKSKEINAREFFMLRDMSEKENLEYKKKFEKQVLDRLGFVWEKERWSL